MFFNDNKNYFMYYCNFNLFWILIMSIESFSLWGAKQIGASNTLYPSNYKRTQYQGSGEFTYWERNSIRETIELAITPKERDIFAREINEATAHWGGKLVRFAKRYACTWAIGLILAPAGAVYHGYSVAKFTVLSLPKIGNGKPLENWNLVKQHAVAFVTDLLFTLFTYSCLGAELGALHAIAFNPGFIVAQEGWWLLMPVGILTFLSGPAFLAASPQVSMTFLSPSRQKMIQYQKGFFLKNECAVVNGAKRPLEGKGSKDDFETVTIDPWKSWLGEGYFHELHVKKGRELLDKMRNINQKLRSHGIKIPDSAMSPNKLIELARKLNGVLGKKEVSHLQEEAKAVKKVFDEFRALNGFLGCAFNP